MIRRFAERTERLIRRRNTGARPGRHAGRGTQAVAWVMVDPVPRDAQVIQRTHQQTPHDGHRLGVLPSGVRLGLAVIAELWHRGRSLASGYQAEWACGRIVHYANGKAAGETKRLRQPPGSGNFQPFIPATLTFIRLTGAGFSISSRIKTRLTF